MLTDQRVWTEEDIPLLTEFYKRYYFGETRPPSSIGKVGSSNGKYPPSKTGNSQLPIAAGSPTKTCSKLLTKVLKIFFSNHDRSYKIAKICTLVNIGFDDRGEWTYQKIASNDTIKHAVYQLVKYGLINRTAHHYYRLRDAEAAQSFIEEKRVPLKPPLPDNETPFIFDGKREMGNIPLPDATNRGLKVVFHNQRFDHLQLTHSLFETLLKGGVLEKQSGKSRSRQWRYIGKAFDVHISDKSYTSWGVLKNQGWQEEMALLSFPPQIIAVVPYHIYTHAAVEDRDDEFRFRVNSEAKGLTMTHDKGSQTFGEEYELEGKLEDVNTGKAMILDTINSFNKIDRTLNEVQEIKQRVTNIESIVCPAHQQTKDGIDYHQ